MSEPTTIKMPAERKPADFPAMLERFKGEIAKALPKHLNPDRMARIALTAFRRTPNLKKCDPRSVFAAVIQASQLGLEPDIQGRAFLIPYGAECQFVPGWKGLVELVNRSGLGSAWTGAVFDGDEFEWALGDSPYVRHRPMGGYNIGELTHVYAVGRTKGGEWPVIEVWPIGRVIAHRDRYNRVGKRHYSYDNLEMYARKVVLLQVLKYMPMSTELAMAVAMNDAAEIGSQGLTVKDAIEGTWTPVQNQDPQNPKESSESAVGTTIAMRDIGPQEISKQEAVPAPESEWPRKDPSGNWTDIRGVRYDDRIHAWSGNRPSVTAANEFRKKRGCDHRLHSELENKQLSELRASGVTIASSVDEADDGFDEQKTHEENQGVPGAGFSVESILKDIVTAKDDDDLDALLALVNDSHLNTEDKERLRIMVDQRRSYLSENKS